jgi:molecular chaperone GrpE (heat shock protein)
MLKKFVILSLVLLLVGTALLAWVFTEQKEDKRLREEQQERLKTDLSKLDKIAGNKIDVRDFGGIAYNDNQQQVSDKYKKREETRELVLTVSGVFMLTGGTILSWSLLLGAARLLIRGSSRLTKSSVDFLRSRAETKDKKPTRADAKPEQEQAPDKGQSKVKKHSKVLTNSGWQRFNENCANEDKAALSQTGVSMESRTSAEGQGRKRGKRRAKKAPVKNAKMDAKTDNSASGNQKPAVLVSDEESIESEEPVRAKSEGLNFKTSPADSSENSLRLEDSLKTQTEDLEKQMAEFKRMAQSVQQTALENSKPVEDTLRELTQQVSAIREYASHQQERVRKLQDGYDWNIIRNFCMRLIRCIDNLENRINKLSKKDIDTRDLEDVRDELVFALESNGVEQFEPEINSDYRGREKNTEAVKEKEKCKDPKLTGKIAKVIRRGYQYFIDEENAKIIRPAQVKLFG